MKIEDRIRNIIHNHSGGMKFTELLTELQVGLCSEIKSKSQKIKVPSPDELEAKILKMKDVKILYYGWKMSPKLIREKLFVYTPL